jgi:CO dehydrogenase nickel-insertion accessory protein CooC1
VTEDGHPLLTLIDLKAGFEDSARGVLVGMDWALVVVDPTLAAVKMAADLKETIEQIKGGAMPATSHLSEGGLVELAHDLYRNARIRGVLCVLNRVPDMDTERYLRGKLSGHGIHPIGVIPSAPGVARSWLQGSQVAVGGYEAEVRRVAEAMEAAEIEASPSEAGVGSGP